MSRTLLALLLAGLAAVTAAVIVVRLGDGGRGAAAEARRLPGPDRAAGRSAELVGSADPLGGTPVPRGERVVARAEPEPLAARAAPRPRLAGRVTRTSDGSPVAGAELVLALRQRASGVASPQRATADGDGRYALELAGPCTLASVQVGATRTTPRASLRVDRPLLPGREEVVDVEVGAGAMLRGRVVDEDGRPVAGADVLAWLDDPVGLDLVDPPDRATTAAEDGTFALHHLGERFVAAALASGLAPITALDGKLDEGEEASGLELVVGPASSLRGRVVDVRGVPIDGQVVDVGTRSWSSGEATAHADVRATRPPGRRVTSGPDGSFEAEPLADLQWFVNVSRPGYRSVGRYELPSAGPIEIVLTRGAVLAGRVVGCDGAPAAGARVRFGGATSAEQLTGPDGRFEASGFAPGGEARVHVHLPGCAIHVEQPVRIAESGDTWVEIALEPARALAGRVADVEGRPVAHAPVRIEGDRIALLDTVMIPTPTWEWRLGLDETRTAEDGSFRFDDLYDGDFEVTATDPGDPRTSVSARARSGREDLEIFLDPAAARRVTLSGRVTDARTGEPVPRFTVTPAHGIEGGRFGVPRAFEDAAGRYEIAGLDPGDIEVSVRADGYADARVPPREYGIGDHRVDVELLPKRSLLVRVVDERGEGMRAHLSVRDDDDRPVRLDLGGWSSGYAIAQPEGTHLHGLPAQPLVVVVEGYDLARQARAPVDLTRPFPGVLEVWAERARPVWITAFAVEANGRLEGAPLHVFEDADASALLEGLDPLDVPEATCSLRTADGDELSSATTQRRPDGSWRSSSSWLGSRTSGGLPISGFRVRVPHRDLLSTPLTLVVEAAGYAPLEARLPDLGGAGDEPLLVLHLDRAR